MTAACSNSVKSPDAIATEEIQFSDSSKAFSCVANLNLPVVTDEVTQNIRETLESAMKEHLGDMGYIDKPVKFNSLDFQEFFNFYDSVATEDYDERHEDMENPEPWEFEINLDKMTETEKYVIFDSNDHVYYGGAHGGRIGLGALTFDLSDGSLVSPTIDPNCTRKIQDILLEGLEGYFESIGYNLKGMELLAVLETRRGLIPLPKLTPYPTDEGMVFTYEEYEIAWYAAGRPTFTVPYEKISEFLTEKAKNIL